jgi:hypothetical protein
MSSATFDPNKIRVEDLFRAKEERREDLARLPFEEKIKIVKKLQTSVSAAMKNEKLIFESFLKVCPDFANEAIEQWDVVEEWYAKRALAPPLQPFDKRPDVICVTASGKKIGVELKSWVNREQIAAARKQERIQENIRKAIGEQRNKTKNIGHVWLSAKQSLAAREAAHFQEQMFALIEQVDSSWFERTDLEQELGFHMDNFSGFPLLERYLQHVEVDPKTQDDCETRWISFRSSVGAYSPNGMLETLKKALLAHSTDARYEDLQKHVGLDEVYLLVHYDFRAFAYNTRFDTSNFGFEDAAKFASNVLNGDGGHFDRIFLFHFLWGEEEAYRIL